MATHRGFRTFGTALNKIGARVDASVDQSHRAVGLELLKRVVFLTPWKTGRLRGNWQVTLDLPAAGAIERFADEAGEPTISAGSTVIGGAKAHNIIWLHNGVPYARYIEDGTPRIAAFAMAKRAAAEVRPIAKQLAEKLLREI